MASSSMRNKQRRVLVVTSGIPSRATGASAVLFYQYIDALKVDGSKLMHLILIEGETLDVAALNAYENDIGMVVGTDIIIAHVPKLLQVSAIQIALSHSSREVIDERIRNFRADVVVAFDVVAAWVSQAVGVSRRIVWLGDLAFQTVYYHGLYTARESIRGLLKLPKALLSSLLWRKAYKRAIQPNDLVICAAHAPVKILARMGISSQYVPYPWPSGQSKERLCSTRPTFVFFGTLNALGSRSAIHFLLKRVYPRLIKLWGRNGFRILIAGRGDVPTWANTAFAHCPEVERLGYVADLGALLASCHAVIAPIDVPVGNRSRILTAMAMNTLVIAHQNAALGNPALRDDATCLLAQDAHGFVDAMRRAVEDRESSERIIKNAKQVYESDFAPEAACNRFVQMVRDHK